MTWWSINSRANQNEQTSGASSNSNHERCGHRNRVFSKTGCLNQSDVADSDKRSDENYSPRLSGGKDSSDESEPDELVLFGRDLVVSILAVLLTGVFLFLISGIWPPMVAIESGSMEPNMEINDLVFVMDNDRFQPSEAHEDTGVVTAQTGTETEYEKFGGPGDVIVFEPDGDTDETPVIHRAMFWVEEGENWCERATREYLEGLSPTDERCEATHSGFITKGDNNGGYDQAAAQQPNYPVKPEWIVGTAEQRVPKVGWLRLQFS